MKLNRSPEVDLFPTPVGINHKFAWYLADGWSNDCLLWPLALFVAPALID